MEKSTRPIFMDNLWTPAKENERLIDEFRRPYCACCGLSPSNPKFGGKVVIANQAGDNGKREIIFCGSCAVKEESQTVYKEIMFPAADSIVVPGGYFNG